MSSDAPAPPATITIGVLALQGAFVEHQRALESISPSHVRTIQVRTPDQLSSIDAIILPGGESTAMGLIGGDTPGLWEALREFVHPRGGGGRGGDGDDDDVDVATAGGGKPTWGTCAGMILLAERCVGTSAVITDGQSLIGGMDVLVCRNYFGSQISSFEMNTPPPPRPPCHGELRRMMGGGRADHHPSLGGERCVLDDDDDVHLSGRDDDATPFPGVFIRAPAILYAGDDVEVLGRVVAAPCRSAAVVLRELERKIDIGEDVVRMGVMDALERGTGGGLSYADARLSSSASARGDDDGATRTNDADGRGIGEEEKREKDAIVRGRINNVTLPGASDESNAREVICAVRRGNILCTAFHPEIADDTRWHEYFVGMVLEAMSERGRLS
jgi:5'-phosphate synthase pdxT subunit